MHRRRLPLSVLIPLLGLPCAAAAQDAAPPAEAVAPAPPAARVVVVPTPVIVEAGTPVPVPLEGVAERLRAELPAVPVSVGPAAGAAPSAAATVTLGLTADGQMHVVYRDATGHEASRIVADTSDPRAVAAAIAMIVANLHRSQMDVALAAIGPAAAAPPPPAPALVAAPVETPPSPPPVIANAPAAPPRARVATRAVVAPRESTWSLWLAPTADTLGDWMAGLESGVELRSGRFRLELALSRSFATQVGRSSPDTWTELTYSQTMAVLRMRHLWTYWDRITVGAGLGVGLVISELSDVWTYRMDGAPDDYSDGRSDLDALVSAGASCDVRLLGHTLYLTTRIDVIASTASEGQYRAVAPDVFGHLITGLRLAL